MSTAYDDFLPYVLPDTPGCPEVTAIQAVRSAVIDFCEQSLILQRDHDPIKAIANQSDYEFEPPKNHLVTKIMRGWFLHDPLMPIAPDMVTDPTVYNATFPDPNVLKGKPRNIVQKDERTFALYPVPDETILNAITLRVALKPTRASTTCDDILFQDYVEFIAHGAKMRLSMTPGKSYTNPDVAALGNVMFRQGINRALQRSVRGHSRSDLQVKLRRP
jgi:hypothetical protein